jgi:hypothetical protein
MEFTLELVYLCAIAALTIVLLLWFILTFVPSVLDLDNKDPNRRD